ncbi:MAG: alkaline phosphatase PafA, partial [Bacteroidota bacterium]
MRRITSLIFCLLLTGKIVAQPPSTSGQSTQKPKVVIGLVVENMRPDYIHRYWDKFGPDGFKK